ncbi:MAG: hypothetical protein ACE5D1_09080, partial [Fidelibacterota bacterium]
MSSAMFSFLPTREALVKTRNRLQGHIHRTPVFTSAGIDRLYSARFYFKCENFQRSGSFKFRATKVGKDTALA